VGRAESGRRSVPSAWSAKPSTHCRRSGVSSSTPSGESTRPSARSPSDPPGSRRSGRPRVAAGSRRPPGPRRCSRHRSARPGGRRWLALVAGRLRRPARGDRPSRSTGRSVAGCASDASDDRPTQRARLRQMTGGICTSKTQFAHGRCTDESFQAQYSSRGGFHSQTRFPGAEIGALGGRDTPTQTTAATAPTDVATVSTSRSSASPRTLRPPTGTPHRRVPSRRLARRLRRRRADPRSDTAPAPGRRHVVAVESDVADGLLQVDARGARNWQA